MGWFSFWNNSDNDNNQNENNDNNKIHNNSKITKDNNNHHHSIKKDDHNITSSSSTTATATATATAIPPPTVIPPTTATTATTTTTTTTIVSSTSRPTIDVKNDTVGEKTNNSKVVKRILPPGACKTCLGVTFFNSLMNDKGTMPKCYGFSDISKPRYIPDDLTAEHAEAADAWTYICIGDSETMEKPPPPVVDGTGGGDSSSNNNNNNNKNSSNSNSNKSIVSSNNNNNNNNNLINCNKKKRPTLPSCRGIVIFDVLETENIEKKQARDKVIERLHQHQQQQNGNGNNQTPTTTKPPHSNDNHHPNPIHENPIINPNNNTLTQPNSDFIMNGFNKITKFWGRVTTNFGERYMNVTKKYVNNMEKQALYLGKFSKKFVYSFFKGPEPPKDGGGNGGDGK